jgi:hypothetical protein
VSDSSPERRTGYRPGDVPHVAWPKHIALVRPSMESAAQKGVAETLRTELGVRGLVATEFAAERRRLPGDGAVEVLRANDAYRLYKLLHRRLVVVLATGGVRVQRDVSEHPSRRGSVPLEQFAAHKAFVRFVTRPEESGPALDAGEAWAAAPPGVDAPGDPRAVPMLCFAGCTPIELGSRAARRAFRQQFGRPPIDRQGGRWEVGPHHTHDLLHVAGTTLPLGFHWDVQATRGRLVVANGWERWEVRQGSYLNVHPDAHLRGSANAVRTHNAISGARQPAGRTPRDKRRARPAK